MTAASHHILSKLSDDEIREKLAQPSAFLQSFVQFEGRPFVLEPYQVAFLEDDRRFRLAEKARQVGFSLLIAAEALYRAMMKDGYTAVIISYNQEDAKEKIKYARELYHSLPHAVRKKLTVDSKTELAFKSNRPGGAVSRIKSFPCKAARGANRADIYLDEFAHYPEDDRVYQGSQAAITRNSERQLSAVSTPLGKRGKFWAIAANDDGKYDHFSRHHIPWWSCRHFCKDVPTAQEKAAFMPTELRVFEFGTPALIEQYAGLDLESFQEEFECFFLDGSMSYYPLALIQCCQEELNLPEDFAQIEHTGGALYAGYDVGRRSDSAELVIFEDVDGVFTMRFRRSFKNTPFRDQEAFLRGVLTRLPLKRMRIDETGIGMHLAENLSADFECVDAVSFSMSTKARWCSGFKIQLQNRSLLLPRDKDLLRQIHSIRREVTGSGNVIFTAPRTKKHGHADMFWACAIAVERPQAEDQDEEWSIGVSDSDARASSNDDPDEEWARDDESGLWLRPGDRGRQRAGGLGRLRR